MGPLAGLLVGLSLLATAPTPPDTVLRVGPGDRLVLSGLDGSVVVTAVEGDRLRLVGAEGTPLRRRDDEVVWEGRGRPRELRVELPPWMPVEIRGREVDVRVRGSSSRVDVRTLEGEIELVDLAGEVNAQSVDGEIVARGVAGRVRLGSVDEDIRVRGARGALTVESTDGDVIVEDAALDELDVSTTDGDIVFDGSFRSGGRYALITHSGDIAATLASGSDVTVEVTTFSGEFDAGFPVTVEGIRSGRKVAFTLGDGGASLRLESFSGDIEIRRPGG